MVSPVSYCTGSGSQHLLHALANWQDSAAAPMHHTQQPWQWQCCTCTRWHDVLKRPGCHVHIMMHSLMHTYTSADGLVWVLVDLLKWECGLYVGCAVWLWHDW